MREKRIVATGLTLLVALVFVVVGCNKNNANGKKPIPGPVVNGSNKAPVTKAPANPPAPASVASTLVGTWRSNCNNNLTDYAASLKLNVFFLADGTGWYYYSYFTDDSCQTPADPDGYTSLDFNYTIGSTTAAADGSYPINLTYTDGSSGFDLITIQPGTPARRMYLGNTYDSGLDGTTADQRPTSLFYRLELLQSN